MRSMAAPAAARMSASGSTKLPSGAFSTSAFSRFEDVRKQALRQHLDGGEACRLVAAVEIGQGQAGCHLAADARLVLGADALAEQRGGLRVGRPQQLGDGVQADGGVRVRQLGAGHQALQHASQAVVGADARQRVPRRRADRLQRDRIEEVGGRQRLVGGGRDEDALIGGADDQAIFEEGAQDDARAGVAARDQLLDDRFLVGEAGVAQARDEAGEIGGRGRCGTAAGGAETASAGAGAGASCAAAPGEARRTTAASSAAIRRHCPPPTGNRSDTLTSFPNRPWSWCCSCRTSG